MDTHGRTSKYGRSMDDAMCPGRSTSSDDTSKSSLESDCSTKSQLRVGECRLDDEKNDDDSRKSSRPAVMG